MAYKAKTWVDLELITAEDMNRLEKGVEEAGNGIGNYVFGISESGDLILYYTGETPPDFYINANGELICNL